MTLDTPTAEIAIIIAAKDAEAPVRETLASLQRQLYSAWETVVVDDGSPDTTGPVAAAVAQVDARFQPVSVSADSVSQARNLGVEATRAEWLLFLDADDQLTHDALDVLRAQRSDRCDAVYTGWRQIALCFTNRGNLPGLSPASRIEIMGSDRFADFVRKLEI